MSKDTASSHHGLPTIRGSKLYVLWLFWLLLLGSAAAGIYRLRYEFRSYSLLAHFANAAASGPLLKLETYPVHEQEQGMLTSVGFVRARIYVPVGVSNPPGMVLLHGIHHLGIDEPRLVNFARAAAGNGFKVLTPELSALADYRVDSASIVTIGESAMLLASRLGPDTGPVTVVAVSFAGGLSLLAAVNPRFAPYMKSLLLMGPYDDLSRVLRFLATSQAELPDGSKEAYKAHDYGAAVFVYSHLEQFFTAGDLRAAHEALRDWLWEQPDQATLLLSTMSPAGRATMEILMARHIDQLRPRLLEAIDTDHAQLAALSGAGQLEKLRVPVFIVHGASDDIIPSTESLWLQNDIPTKYLRAVLITPAFSHVDPEKHASWKDELRLVNFLAGVLRNADERRAN